MEIDARVEGSKGREKVAPQLSLHIKEWLSINPPTSPPPLLSFFYVQCSIWCFESVGFKVVLKFNSMFTPCAPFWPSSGESKWWWKRWCITRRTSYKLTLCGASEKCFPRRALFLYFKIYTIKLHSHSCPCYFYPSYFYISACIIMIPPPPSSVRGKGVHGQEMLFREDA